MTFFLNNGRIVITLITIIISILCFILTLYRQNQSTTTTTIIKPGKKVAVKKTKINRSKNLEYHSHMKMKPKQSRHQQIQPIMIALP